MTKQGVRRALTGSTFDPPHNGHVAAVMAMLRSGLFDEVVVSVAGTTPGFKDNPSQGLHRQQLAQLVFPQELIFDPPPGHARLLLDHAPSMGEEEPTALRMAGFAELYPGDTHTFVTGSDAITPDLNGNLPIHRWRYQRWLRTTPILIIPRAGFAQPSDLNITQIGFSSINWFPGFEDGFEPLPNISSSAIRELIAAGSDAWRELVPSPVAQYIDLVGLYR